MPPEQDRPQQPVRLGNAARGPGRRSIGGLPARAGRLVLGHAAVWAASLGLVLLASACTGPSTAMSAANEASRTGRSSPAASIPSATTPAPTALPTETPPDPTQDAIPRVVAAVRAARRGRPLPDPLIPPVPDILLDQYPPIPDCWELRGEPHHLARCTLFGGSARTIVLIGDSHARQWLTPLAAMAKRDGWNVVPLWHIGCYPTTYHAGRECADFVRWSVRQVQTLRPDVVLIGGTYVFENDAAIHRTTSGFVWLVHQVEPFASHVVVAGDPPRLSFQPTQCLGTPNRTLTTCLSTLKPAQIAVYEAVDRTATDAGAAFLDTIGWYCFDGQCPAVVGHRVTYREDDHIARHYAMTLDRLFRAAFESAISSPSP